MLFDGIVHLKRSTNLTKKILYNEVYSYILLYARIIAKY